MWTAEQSPCRPGAFGDVTYDPTPRIEGFFGFGGNCNARKTVTIAVADDSATASATPGRGSPTQEDGLGDANGENILEGNFAVGATAVAPEKGSDPQLLEISPATAGLSAQAGEAEKPQLVEASVAVRLRGQKQSDLTVPGFAVAGKDSSTEPVNARGPRNAGQGNGSAVVTAQAAPDRAVRGADGGVALKASAAGVAGVADALERQQGPTAQCPDFRCNWPRTGFFFDRPGKGHQAVIVTAYTNQPFECWRICRRTEHCAFWMFEMQAIQGRCKLWRKEQSPCEPADPADVTSTTYQQRADGLFVVGGNCEGALLPSSARAARAGLGVRSKGGLTTCAVLNAHVGADIIGANVDGTADISILRRGASVYLSYKITAQGLTQRPSSSPAIVARNPCSPSSTSSTSSSTSSSSPAVAASASLSGDGSLHASLSPSTGATGSDGSLSAAGGLSASTNLLNTGATAAGSTDASLPKATASGSGFIAASTALLNTSATASGGAHASLPNATLSGSGSLSASTGLLNTSARAGAGAAASLPNGTVSGSGSLAASSGLLNTSADVGAGVNAGSGGVQANLGGSVNLDLNPAGVISGIGGVVSGAGGAVGSVVVSAGKTAGSVVGSVGNIAGSVIGTAGKVAGSAGKAAGSALSSVPSILSPLVVLPGAWVKAAVDAKVGVNIGAAGAAAASVYAMVGETRLSADLASSLLARISARSSSASAPLPLFLYLNAHQNLVAFLQ
ncbi:unnamed protein product [Closterium sp. Naga37s-1]|nr:unnamed protein product [Closterium sp. Naga37s-1]